MSLPKVSIRALLFGVFLIAVDCSVFRDIGRPASGYPFLFGTLGVCLMSHILAITCYRRYFQRMIGQPFYVGFALSGALAIAVWISFSMFANETWLGPLSHARIFLSRYMPGAGSMVVALFCLSTALPQLLVALAGGYLGRYFARRFARSNPVELRSA